MLSRLLAALGLSAGMLLVAGAAAAQDTPPPNDYSKADAWVCRPDKTDGNACRYDLTATVIRGDGKETVERFHADPKAAIDCFYVYPTVSNDPGVISDMHADREEQNVAKVQFARFGSVCRLYAPLYRQFTLTALKAAQLGHPMGNGKRPTTPYDDVKDAWNYYLEHYNHGRGVVLVGHSQGSGILTELIKNEIDGKPVQKRLVSAILMGTRLPVEKGKTTGYFQHIPLCARPSETGCVIAYSSFRDTVPPPPNSLFGRVQQPGDIAACTNPANLTPGGKGTFHAYMSNGAQIADAASTVTWVKGEPNPTTPFVEVPGLLTGQCVQKNGFSYLQVHVNADPKDPRTDDINGDVVIGGQVIPSWGLHLIDANLAMGNLVSIVGAEEKAYLARTKK